MGRITKKSASDIYSMYTTLAIVILVLLCNAHIMEAKGRRNVLLTSGWQYNPPPQPHLQSPPHLQSQLNLRSQPQVQEQPHIQGQAYLLGQSYLQGQPHLQPQPPIISGMHPGAHQYFFPRTENYYHRMKPDAVVEIVMDPSEEIGPTMVEHSSMTTSIHSQAEYRASCVKEPGCRWECEPRAEDLPPDCDCVCFYTDAKWDHIP